MDARNFSSGRVVVRNFLALRTEWLFSERRRWMAALFRNSDQIAISLSSLPVLAFIELGAEI